MSTLQSPRAAFAGLLATLILAGCGGEEVGELTELRNAIEDDASCSELFEIRNSWDPDYPHMERANENLREIGCHSSTSARTD